MEHLPRLALSVRQPWAWAIVAGHKVIENRSLGSIRAGRMAPGHICLHAAKGLKEDEYRWGYWRLQQHGVRCPWPTDLPRGAIIGTVEVTEVIRRGDSDWDDNPWFGGEAGLVLANPRPIDPIPAAGALGYFEWAQAAQLPEDAAWMTKYRGGGLFDDAPLQFTEPPPKPWSGKG